MSQYVLRGAKPLQGTIAVHGSKNAALPLLAATLLTQETVILKNVPHIRDVDSLLAILSSLGADVERQGDTVQVTAAELKLNGLAKDMVGQLRGSILLLGALLGRDRLVTLPRPGGDVIGARPLDVHFDALAQLGATISETNESVTIDGAQLKAGSVTLQEFSVTATENVLLVAASLPGTTIIRIAAAEPHVVALAELLTAMGATIEGAGSHTITVHGSTELGGASISVIPDMLEAGFFILLAAASQSRLTVTSVPVDHLRLFFKKLDDIGVNYEIEGDNVMVTPARLSAFRMQSLIYPGIATDLQAPFSVVATQANGSSLIHDPMYEGRLRHVGELAKMGANVTICDPHRIIVVGPTELVGKHIKSLDVRAGATLVMAGLIASGETIIDNVEIIERGYADLVGRLKGIGADIERRDEK